MKTLLFILLVGNSLLAQNFTWKSVDKVNGEIGALVGIPGDVLTTSLTFSNTSSGKISVSMRRNKNDLPSYWTLCYCYLQCYDPSDDNITVELEPLSTAEVILYFKTDSVNPGIAEASFQIQQNGSSQVQTIEVTASTMSSVGMVDFGSLSSKLLVYPNPAQEELNIEIGSERVTKVIICDIGGRTLKINSRRANTGMNINTTELVGGLYFITIITPEFTYKATFIKE